MSCQNYPNRDSMAVGNALIRIFLYCMGESVS